MKRECVSNTILLNIIKVQTEVVQERTDLGNIMDLITQRTREITNCDGACIELLEDEEFVYSAVAGMVENFLGLRLSIDSSLSGACMIEKKPLISNNIELDNRVNKEACRKIGLNAMIVAPLIYQEEVVGILKVLSKEVNYFNTLHVQVLELISDFIAAAISSAMRNDKSKLLYKATHDSLTGISNRALFYDHLRKKMAKAKKKKEELSVLILDMDGLKQINDSFGHRAGDAAIKEVTTRIKDLLQKNDTFSRLGGDEFGIITSNKVMTHQLIEEISETIAKPFTYEGNEILLSVSVGCSFLNEDGVTKDELIERADQSMYCMKREKKGKKNSSVQC